MRGIITDFDEIARDDFAVFTTNAHRCCRNQSSNFLAVGMQTIQVTWHPGMLPLVLRRRKVNILFCTLVWSTPWLRIQLITLNFSDFSKKYFSVTWTRDSHTYNILCRNNLSWLPASKIYSLLPILHYEFNHCLQQTLKKMPGLGNIILKRPDIFGDFWGIKIKSVTF